MGWPHVIEWVTRDDALRDGCCEDGVKEWAEARHPTATAVHVEELVAVAVASWGLDPVDARDALVAARVDGIHKAALSQQAGNGVGGDNTSAYGHGWVLTTNGGDGWGVDPTWSRADGDGGADGGGSSDGGGRGGWQCH